MMNEINLKSKWDVFNLPLDSIPEGELHVVGEDGYFLTNKDYIIRWNKLFRDMENKLMYGKLF